MTSLFICKGISKRISFIFCDEKKETNRLKAKTVITVITIVFIIIIFFLSIERRRRRRWVLLSPKIKK